MSLLDATAISRLQIEFRQSMRTLLLALCQDIEEHYVKLAEQFELPVEYFRFLARRLAFSAYSNWKVVGWIEALNELVYFMDLLAQTRHERDRRGFAEQLFRECEHKFFENSYLNELFPIGRGQSRGLAGRLQSLSRRLSLEIIQESLFLEPDGPLQWLKRHRRHAWTV